MEIYFVKHGQTPSASEMRLSIGDEGLVDEGAAEAQRAAIALARQLQGKRITRIIVSPRRRTSETAAIIANELDVRQDLIQIDERLVERDCTPYLGQRIEEVFSKSENELVAGGMESLQDLYERTRLLYKDVSQNNQDGIVLLVGHSGNLAPLVFAAQGAVYGDSATIPPLALDEVLRLI